MADDPDAIRWWELYDYWRSKHIDGQPPSRDTLDPPIDLPHLAPDLMLVDVLPQGFAYRLVGSNVVKGAGIGMTGISPGSSGRYSHVMDAWTGAMQAVHADGRPRLLTACFAAHVTAKTEWLLLPLAAAADGMPKILGGMFLDGIFAPGTDILGFDVVIVDR